MALIGRWRTGFTLLRNGVFKSNLQARHPGNKSNKIKWVGIEWKGLNSETQGSLCFLKEAKSALKLIQWMAQGLAQRKCSKVYVQRESDGEQVNKSGHVSRMAVSLGLTPCPCGHPA